jgi:acyl carrier protein
LVIQGLNHAVVTGQYQAVNFDQARAVVVEALARVLEIEPAHIRDEMVLTTDLGADSLAVVETVFGVEAQLGLRLRDEAVRGARTVADLVSVVTG